MTRRRTGHATQPNPSAETGGWPKYPPIIGQFHNQESAIGSETALFSSTYLHALFNRHQRRSASTIEKITIPTKSPTDLIIHLFTRRACRRELTNRTRAASNP